MGFPDFEQNVLGGRMKSYPRVLQREARGSQYSHASGGLWHSWPFTGFDLKSMEVSKGMKLERMP